MYLWCNCSSVFIFYFKRVFVCSKASYINLDEDTYGSPTSNQLDPHLKLFAFRSWKNLRKLDKIQLTLTPFEYTYLNL